MPKKIGLLFFLNVPCWSYQHSVITKKLFLLHIRLLDDTEKILTIIPFNQGLTYTQARLFENDEERRRNGTEMFFRIPFQSYSALLIWENLKTLSEKDILKKSWRRKWKIEWTLHALVCQWNFCNVISSC